MTQELVAVDDDAVMAAAEAWRFAPEDAQVVATGEYSLALFPRDFLGFAQVEWVRARRELPVVAAELAGLTRAAGRDHLRWWTGPRSEPADQEEWLRARCGEPIDEVVIVARDLAAPRAAAGPRAERARGLRAEPGPEAGPDLVAEHPAASDPAAVRSTVAASEQEALAAHQLNALAWGYAAGAREEALARRAPRELAERHRAQVLTTVDGLPACAARVEVEGTVARLSGGATVETLRGRGAYRDNLETRLALAWEWGARVALVKAVATTSAPVLARWGFSEHGRLRCYRLEARFTNG